MLLFGCLQVPQVKRLHHVLLVRHFEELLYWRRNRRELRRVLNNQLGPLMVLVNIAVLEALIDAAVSGANFQYLVVVVVVVVLQGVLEALDDCGWVLSDLFAVVVPIAS